LVGTDDVWASRGRLPRNPWRGRPAVKVHISHTILIDDLTDDEVIAQTRAAISRHIAELS
jgi:hypothetical protein